MPVLVAIRSSRLMPGLRAMPAVTITTSLPAVGSYVVAPMILQSTPATGVASNRSRALPCGMPSTWGMSTRTTSPSSLLTAQWAQVAPTFPAPMMLILARRMLRRSLPSTDGYDEISPRAQTFGAREGYMDILPGMGPSDYRERGIGFN